MSWTARFVTGSLAGAVSLIVLAFIALFGFQRLGLDLAATIALILGTVLTVGLGVGLMTLMFYSSRSGRDEMVGGEHYERRPHGRG